MNEYSADDVDLVPRLVNLLGRRDVGRDTAILIGEAISADAKFNLWILQVGKKELTEDEFIKMLDESDPIVARCCAAARKYSGHLDREELHAAIRETTRFFMEVTNRGFQRGAVVKD